MAEGVVVGVRDREREDRWRQTKEATPGFAQTEPSTFPANREGRNVRSSRSDWLPPKSFDYAELSRRVQFEPDRASRASPSPGSPCPALPTINDARAGRSVRTFLAIASKIGTYFLLGHWCIITNRHQNALSCMTRSPGRADSDRTTVVTVNIAASTPLLHLPKPIQRIRNGKGTAGIYEIRWQ